MAANVIVDAAFLIAFVDRREANHRWARDRARQLPLPWKTCEAAVSEAFHILGPKGAPSLAALLGRRAVVSEFNFAAEIDNALKLMTKYADVPMSFADACLVRMTELLSEPLLLTLDADFSVYRRHGRQTIPCVMPR
jgi:predicted nucleic acid-binding protein